MFRHGHIADNLVALTIYGPEWSAEPKHWHTTLPGNEDISEAARWFVFANFPDTVDYSARRVEPPNPLVSRARYAIGALLVMISRPSEASAEHASDGAATFS